MPKKSHTQRRNNSLFKRFKELEIKYPQWKTEAVIEVLEKEFFLSKASIYKILQRK